jgi:hypothetical protein
VDALNKNNDRNGSLRWHLLSGEWLSSVKSQFIIEVESQMAWDEILIENKMRKLYILFILGFQGAERYGMVKYHWNCCKTGRNMIAGFLLWKSCILTEGYLIGHLGWEREMFK